MRRTAAVVLAASVAAGVSACSPAGLLREDRTVPPGATAAPTGVIPSSRLFDQAFPYAAEGGEVTLTVTNLRMIASQMHTDHVVAVDLRAVQSAGQPAVDPAQIHAFGPGGEEFERVRYPKGTVDDPLIRTVLQAPGQEVRGTVVWTMPLGARIGRIDVTGPGSVGSITVTRQPADPEATSAASPGSSTSTTTG